jgi:hypothetical protein
VDLVLVLERLLEEVTKVNMPVLVARRMIEGSKEVSPVSEDVSLSTVSARIDSTD